MMSAHSLESPRTVKTQKSSNGWPGFSQPSWLLAARSKSLAIGIGKDSFGPGSARDWSARSGIHNARSIWAFVRSLVRSCVQCVCSFVRSCIRSFVLSCVHSFERSFVGAFVRAFVRSCVRNRSFVCAFVPSCVRSFVRVRSFVCSSFDPRQVYTSLENNLAT
jgi:hypothetical protein